MGREYIVNIKGNSNLIRAINNSDNTGYFTNSKKVAELYGIKGIDGVRIENDENYNKYIALLNNQDGLTGLGCNIGAFIVDINRNWKNICFLNENKSLKITKKILNIHGSGDTRLIVGDIIKLAQEYGFNKEEIRHIIDILSIINQSITVPIVNCVYPITFIGTKLFDNMIVNVIRHENGQYKMSFDSHSICFDLSYDPKSHETILCSRSLRFRFSNYCIENYILAMLQKDQFDDHDMAGLNEYISECESFYDNSGLLGYKELIDMFNMRDETKAVTKKLIFNKKYKEILELLTIQEDSKELHRLVSLKTDSKIDNKIFENLEELYNTRTNKNKNGYNWYTQGQEGTFIVDHGRNYELKINGHPICNNIIIKNKKLNESNIVIYILKEIKEHEVDIEGSDVQFLVNNLHQAIFTPIIKLLCSNEEYAICKNTTLVSYIHGTIAESISDSKIKINITQYDISKIDIRIYNGNISLNFVFDKEYKKLELQDLSFDFNKLDIKKYILAIILYSNGMDSDKLMDYINKFEQYCNLIGEDINTNLYKEYCGYDGGIKEAIFNDNMFINSIFYDFEERNACNLPITEKYRLLSSLSVDGNNCDCGKNFYDFIDRMNEITKSKDSQKIEDVIIRSKLNYDSIGRKPNQKSNQKLKIKIILYRAIYIREKLQKSIKGYDRRNINENSNNSTSEDSNSSGNNSRHIMEESKKGEEYSEDMSHNHLEIFVKFKTLKDEYSKCQSTINSFVIDEIANMDRSKIIEIKNSQKKYLNAMIDFLQLVVKNRISYKQLKTLFSDIGNLLGLINNNTFKNIAQRNTGCFYGMLDKIGVHHHTTITESATYISKSLFGTIS